MSSEKRPVMLVLGAGAGIGGNVAKRFAAGGYHAVLARRTDEEGLARLVAEITDLGGEATGRIVNVVAENSVEALVEEIERDIGPIEVAVYNIGAQLGTRPLAETTYKAYENGWRLGNFGLFRLASSLLPQMEARGRGCLLVTSATSAFRGNAGQHSHAAAMGGRRMLSQTLNAEFAPKGIHVSHILIDGRVNSPDTVGRFLMDREKFAQAMAEAGEDEVTVPYELAETYFHLAHQHRSAWTFELDIRPFTTRPWWNSEPPAPTRKA